MLALQESSRLPQAMLHRMITKEALEISTQEWGKGEHVAPRHPVNRWQVTVLFWDETRSEWTEWV